MKKNSSAYILTKSLTMSEKRYFKIFSERHTIGSQNKYVALFDLLDKSEKENDSEIKDNLKKNGINPEFLRRIAWVDGRYVRGYYRETPNSGELTAIYELKGF